MRSAARAVGVIQDPRYQEHRSPGGHPERPERLDAVAKAVAERADELTPLAARPATDEELLRIHPREHLQTVAEAAKRAPLQLDADTFISAASHDVARLAAGASIDLARAVARGELDCGFAAVRPPGHHAEADRAMGFCLFNNVAIAARALQAEEGLERVMILDWDVHHGNGSQHSFEDDASVLYSSTHQFPFYPGTGAANENGRGKAEGTTVNVPMPAGCGDAEYLGVAQRILIPVVERYRPELILISCGFDAHESDPLASMQLSGDGFRDLAASLRQVADSVCGGRLVAILEGGYAPRGLHEGTQALLDVLLAPEAPTVASGPKLEPGSTLRGVVERVTNVQQRHYPGIGSV